MENKIRICCEISNNGTREFIIGKNDPSDIFLKIPFNERELQLIEELECVLNKVEDNSVITKLEEVNGLKKFAIYQKPFCTNDGYRLIDIESIFENYDYNMIKYLIGNDIDEDIKKLFKGITINSMDSCNVAIVRATGTQAIYNVELYPTDTVKDLEYRCNHLVKRLSGDGYYPFGKLKYIELICIGRNYDEAWAIESSFKYNIY